MNNWKNEISNKNLTKAYGKVLPKPLGNILQLLNFLVQEVENCRVYEILGCGGSSIEVVLVPRQAIDVVDMHEKFFYVFRAIFTSAVPDMIRFGSENQTVRVTIRDQV